MSDLARFQRALAAAVTGGPVEHNAQQLLDGLSKVGIAMTARVQRSWCEGRARRAAPLTLSALPEDHRSALLSAWVERGGGTSSYFASEASEFLDFIAERLDGATHQMALCRLERAVIRARSAPWVERPLPPLDGAAVLQRSPEADLVVLRTSAGELLGALEGSRQWTELDDAPQRLLVAPGIDGLVREASDQEIALWRALGAGSRAVADLPTARDLLACGALCVVSIEAG